MFRPSWVHPQGDSCICRMIYVTCIGVSSLVDSRVYITMHAAKTWKRRITFTNHHHHHHHLANMQLGYLLARSGLTILEFSFMVFPGFFCPLVCSILVFSVIYDGVFSFYVANNFLYIPVFCPKMGLHLSLLQSLYLFYNLSKCILLFFSNIFRLCCCYSSQVSSNIS